MTGMIERALIAGLLGSVIIALLLLPIAEVNDNYNVGIATSDLETIDRLSELETDITGLQNTAVDDSAVSTEESEASFFRNSFTVTKFIFTGGPLVILQAMITDIANVAHIPPMVVTFIIGTLIVVLTFAMIRGVTGR